MLKKIRVILATICLVAITLLFLDFTGTLHGWLGWLAKIQFLPAVLALNLVVIVALLLVTILFGRVYCSVICPLGVFQDAVANLSKKGKKGKYTYSKEIKWLRYGVWALFVIALIAGVNAFVALLAPYSAWGRIVQNLLAPVWQWGNNLLALIAERHESYAFYTKDVWLKSLPTFIVAVVTLVAVVVLAWKNGRTYCNTICPVGTTLSFFSRFAMFRPVIDKTMCKKCHQCERKCKAACIDIDGGMTIDYSRCVDCFNCIDTCKFGGLKYRFAWKRASTSSATGQVPEQKQPVPEPVEGPADKTRRAFLVGSALALGGTALSGVKAKAQTEAAEEEAVEIEGEGGFADIIPKVSPKRSVAITPFGSESVDKFFKHCTACQLCVSVCPNNVLRPSKDLGHLMQPVMSFERGYCRPECVKCSEVCPAGAILKITPEEKTQWKVGTASVNPALCLVENGEVEECGNCSRHCPAGAIHMVRKVREDGKTVRVPSVEEEKCIGCGACENLCPSRPISAITVDGYQVHHKA
ncbi:MAG: 4Fe-4S dicluster domain-containing protein [Bacteroidales bacterium]|nr:4Fe-4S dicluster domain-containing protein [Bacteroidales bacterium]